jgi:hypothetical protein
MPKTIVVDRVFTGVRQTELRDLLGDSSARLLPRLAQAAAKYQESERETHTQAERRQEIAKSHIAVLNGTQKDIGHLLVRLDAVSALIPDASKHGYLPGTATSGSLGGLAVEVATKVKLDAIREAVQIASAAVDEWREIARLDMRRKRGRKVGSRWVLAEWIALQLAREGVPLKKSADGKLARVLTIMYEAARITAPLDLYPDVLHAIKQTAHERQRLH